MVDKEGQPHGGWLGCSVMIKDSLTAWLAQCLAKVELTTNSYKNTNIASRLRPTACRVIRV